jgi:glutamine amidotransferase
MTFGFAFLSNDAGLLSVALEPFASALQRDGGKRGWGLGYYHAGQPLIRKRPKDPAGVVDFCVATKTLRADHLIGHIRPADAESATSDNTAPFRFRHWLFLACGTVKDFDVVKPEILGSVPEFMRHNVRGNTTSEILFHLFLAFLNDTGRMDDHRLTGDVAAQAMISTLTYLSRLAGDHDLAAPSLSCIATNGQLVIAAQRGVPMAVGRRSSYTNVRRDADNRPVSFPHLRTVLLTCGLVPEPGEGWEQVGGGEVLSIDVELNIQHHRG